MRILKNCKSMAEVRSEIDRLDGAIVDLLAQRMEFVRQAGNIKSSRDLIRNEARVQDVLAKVREHARAYSIDEGLTDALYRLLIERSIEYEFSVFDAKRKTEA